MSLSDTAVRLAKGKEKQYKMTDDLGLYLLVKPNGSKLWRMDYQFAGKRNTLSFGQYPSVKLAEARKERDDTREIMGRGDDPKVVRKLKKIADEARARATFKLVAEDLIQKIKDEKKAQKTIDKYTWHLLDLAKPLHDRPVADVQPPEILDIIQRIYRKGFHDTANRMRGSISKVFRLAVATGKAARDPTQDLKGAIAAAVPQSYAAITDEKQFGALMAAIDAHDGWPTLRYALKMIALTATRPSEIRKAKWAEFDIQAAKWTIPAERMKARREHIVPLSRQAIQVIKTLRGITDRDEYVFAALRSDQKVLSENAMNSALRRMGYTKDEHVSHGFRSSFSTIMNDRRHDGEIIEAVLAHRDTSTRGIYNRAKYWKERAKLMQVWADLVDELQGVKAKIGEVPEFEDLGI